MKKILFFAIMVFILAACGGGEKKTVVETDSVFSEDTVEEDADSIGYPVIYITADSVGPVKIGMLMRNIPDSIPGVYSAKRNGASVDAVIAEFIAPDGEGESFVGYDFGEGKVDVINLVGNQVKVNAPRGDFGMGDSFRKVLELPGVKAEWGEDENNGSWYWRWHGLWFAPSQEHLSESLARRLYHSDMPPTQADFDDETTIGFIGTGLPF